jgi:peroxiredoxin
MKAAGIVLAVVVISSAARLCGQDALGETTAASMAPAMPDWELKATDGKPVRSADFKGKVVVLDFWATWCGPCRAEIPGFIALQKRHEQEGVAVIGVALDDGGAETVKRFAQKEGVNYPVVLADEETQRVFGGIEAVPTTFIIDRAGQIVKKHVGFADADELEKEIQALLKP